MRLSVTPAQANTSRKKRVPEHSHPIPSSALRTRNLWLQTSKAASSLTKEARERILHIELEQQAAFCEQQHKQAISFLREAQQARDRALCEILRQLPDAIITVFEALLDSHKKLRSACLYRRIVRALLGSLDREHIKLSVHPSDLKTLQTALASNCSDVLNDKNTIVFTDSALLPGDARISTPSGEIQLNIRKHMNLLVPLLVDEITLVLKRCEADFLAKSQPKELIHDVSDG